MLSLLWTHVSFLESLTAGTTPARKAWCKSCTSTKSWLFETYVYLERLMYAENTEAPLNLFDRDRRLTSVTQADKDDYSNCKSNTAPHSHSRWRLDLNATQCNHRSLPVNVSLYSHKLHSTVIKPPGLSEVKLRKGAFLHAGAGMWLDTIYCLALNTQSLYSIQS